MLDSAVTNVHAPILTALSEAGSGRRETLDEALQNIEESRDDA
jgi:hypothetical protein